MPVINGVYTKDFPNLGRDLVDSDIIVVAIPGNNVTYKTTYGALKTYINLANLVPYTGATTDVNLGTHSLSAESITLDPTPATIPTAQGSLYFDDDELTLAVVLNGTVQKVGEDVFFQIKNQSGSTIPKGTAVRFDGVVGGSGRILAVPFLADGTYPSIYFLGITSEEIANGGDGKAYMTGKIRGINTNAYAVGTILYCSTTVAGGYQTTAPVAPNNIISVAAVINQSATVGEILVRPTLGSNINRDEGVLITSPTTGDLLQLQSDGLWKNKTVASLGLVPTSRTLTINGTAYDLSADRTWSVGTVTSVAALTIGSTGTDITSTVANGTTTPVITLNVPDASATARGVITTGSQTIAGAKTLTGLLSGTTISLSDTGQFFQNIGAATVSKFIRIGNTSADLSFGVEGSASTIISAVNGGVAYSSVLTTNNSTSLILGTSGVAAITIASNQGVTFSNAVTNLGGLKVQTSTNGTNGISFGTSSVNYHTIIYDDSTKKLNFNTDGTTRAITFSNSNIVIGSTTDSGYKLDVNGTGRFSGALLISNNDITQTGTRPILSLQQSGTTKAFWGISSGASDLVVGDSSGDAVFRKPASSGAFRWSVDGGTSSALVIASTGLSTFSSSIAGDWNTKIINTNSTNGYGLYVQGANNASTALLGLHNGSAYQFWVAGNGNVGIGTTSPTAVLHLSSTSPTFYLDDTSTSGTRKRFKMISGDVGTTQSVLFQFDNTSDTNLITTMTVNESGNVGIGTTSPDASDWNASARLLHIYQNTTNGSVIKIESSNASGIVAVGNNAMQLGTITDDPLLFYTNITERMRITSVGEVLINTTTDSGDYKLQVNGNVLATGYFESSSVEGKNIIQTNPLTQMYPDVIQYTRKTDENKDIRYGYSAEQIHELMPELTDENVSAVKYIDVHTLLIAQLQKEIKELKAKIN